jgi:hypothetical protein
MTVEDFMRDLNGLGTRVGRMELHLLEVSAEIINDMISEAPIDTGDLRDSMKRYIENHRLRFTMLYYGPFQNYGVVGSKTNQSVKDVQFGVLPRPASDNKYRFKDDPFPVGGDLPFGARLTIRRFGLKPQEFFDVVDIKNKIAVGIQERIDNLNQ